MSSHRLVRVSVPVLVLAGLVATTPPSLARGAVAPGDVEALRAELGALLGVDLAPLQPTDTASAGCRAQVAELVGCSVDELAAVQVFDSARLGKDGSLGPEVVVVEVPLSGIEGATRLAVAVNKTGIVGAAAVLRDDGGLDENWRPFLSQVAGRHLPRRDKLRTPADLERLRSESLQSREPKQRLLGALVRQRELMMQQSMITRPLFQAAQRGGTPDLDAASADRLHEIFQELAGLTDDLVPALGAAADAYRQQLEQVNRALGDLVESMKDGGAASMGALQTTGQACNTCHQLQANPGGFVPLGIQASVSRRRATLGVGNDVFAVGYDLAVPSVDEQDGARAVAESLRRALYVLAVAWS